MDAEIKEIDTIFKKLSDKNRIRVDFDSRLTRALFEKIVERLTYKEENGGMGFEYEMKSYLRVEVPKSKYIFSVVGKNYVKWYWQFGRRPDEEERRRLDDGKESGWGYMMEDVKQSHDISKYGISVKLIEDEVRDSEKGVEKEMGDATVKKKYIYRNIYEVKDAEWKFITALIEERSVESEKSFKDSGCLSAVPKYYIELRFNGDLDLSAKEVEGLGEAKTFIGYFERYLHWLLEEIQQTSFVITFDEKKSLLNSFKKLTKQTELRGHNFILAEPVEVLRRNFHKRDGVKFVKEDYAMSYMPAGELRFLFISENFSKNVDGKIFMITRNFELINTGKIVKGFENTLLEGYYLETSNMFYITDIMFYKGNDVRGHKFFQVGGGAKDKYRFDYLGQFYREALQSAEYVDPELREDATRFVLSRYLFGNGPRFDENVNELFDKVKLLDFMVTGLQFRPMDEGYPERGGKWYSFFRWNYPRYRTGEFLVKYMKDDGGKNDKLSPFQLPSKGKDLYGKIIYYKSLYLKVGGYREVKGKKILTPIDYEPRGTDPDLNINIANIPLSDSGKVEAVDPFSGRSDVIEGESIVEFSFERIYGEYTDIFKWTPLRINYAKTQMYRDGQEEFGMTENYGNHVWLALTNTITETNLREGTVPEEDISNAYYADESQRSKKYPIRVFHNRVVKDKLIMSVCPAILSRSKKMMGSLLDLACGSGGDTLKWKLGLLKDVVGIDISKDNIDIANEMYKKARRPKANITYIWGDSSKLIFPDFDAGLDYQAKDLMKKTFLSKNQYDVVSVQFAIHYMFESEITVRTLLQNVSDNLKVGGYFIGTSFDGERVYNLMKDQESKEGFIGDDLYWRIKRNYDLKRWDEKKPNLGHEIEVFVSTIGISHKEYLVNYKYFEELAGEYGLELESVKGFGELYDEAIVARTEWDDELKNMSLAEKMFSFLNNEFKFVKRRDASDAVYRKLMDLIARKAKKDAKTSNFENKKFTIKVRSGGGEKLKNFGNETNMM